MTCYLQLGPTSDFLYCPDNANIIMVILVGDFQLTRTVLFIMTVLIYIINCVSVLIHFIPYPWQYLLYISYSFFSQQSLSSHEVIVPYSFNWHYSDDNFY